MSLVKLLEPLLEGGIKSTNHFNGRLLNAEDLKVDQDADRSRDALLGQALGPGVAQGLVVRIKSGNAARPVLTVDPGVALNRDGQALRLPGAEPCELELTRANETTTSSSSPFLICDPVASSLTPTGTGTYVLVMGPVQGKEGSAPVSNATIGAADACCRARNTVNGITFNLIKLEPSGLDLSDPNMNRNLLAHYCFGTSTLIAQGASKVLASAAMFEYSPLEADGLIPSSQVPLALISWSSKGLDFVDLWAVRRGSTAPTESLWPLITGPRRLVEASAMFHQFQDQLEAIRTAGGADKVSATSLFRYLPPVGIVPLATSGTKDPNTGSTGSTAGFTLSAFFSGISDGEITTVPQEVVRAIVFGSMLIEPLDLQQLIEKKESLLILQPIGITSYVIFVRPLGLQDEEAPQDPTHEETGDQKLASMTVTLEAVDRGLEGYHNLPNYSEERDIPSRGGTRSLRVSGSGMHMATDSTAAKPATTDPLQGKVKVWAEDAVGNRYTGRLLRKKGIAGAAASLSFGLDSLPPGIYRVTGQAVGYTTSRKSVKLGPGEHLKLTLRLARRAHQVPRKPPIRARPKWLEQYDIGKVVVIEQPRWPDPPEDPYADWKRVRPPEEGDPWVTGWGEYLATKDTQTPVDPGDIYIALNPAYEPGAVTTDPYAFLVFGAGGVALPLVTVASSSALEQEIDLSAAGMTGINAHTRRNLEATGLDSVDVLGAAWTGLVSELLELSPTVASHTILAARNLGSKLKGSLKSTVGVGVEVEDILSEELGITSATELARANPGDISRALEARGIKVDAAYSLRIVDSAKRSTLNLRGGP